MHPTFQILAKNRHLIDDSGSKLLAINPPDNALFSVFDKAFCVTTDFRCHRSCSEGQSEFGLEKLSTKFDLAVVFMTKSKKELGLLMDYALANVSENGSIYLVGEKKSGIESGAKLIKSLGKLSKLDSAKHCQLWCLYPDKANLREFDLSKWFQSYKLEFSGRSFEISTIPGVFSFDGLDDATALLLEALSESKLERVKGRVIDFGCGTGVLGVVAGVLFPSIQMEMVDVSWIALQCSIRTAELNGLDATIYPSDVWSDIVGRVDGVITNPPFHRGIKTDYSVTESFIGEAPNHMNKFAQFYLVANHFLKYAEPIERAFSFCEVLEQTNKFKVYYTSR